jgi:hypothetical protein
VIIYNFYLIGIAAFEAKANAPRKKEFPVTTNEFPVHAKKFPVPDEKFPVLLVSGNWPATH